MSRLTMKEIGVLHDRVLQFLGDDEGSTNHPNLSFECGVLAVLDRLVGIDSEYADVLTDQFFTGWRENGDSGEASLVSRNDEVEVLHERIKRDD